MVAGLLCSAMPAYAEYRLQAGDVLEISVAGVPELRQRVTVQLDGSISFPLVGTLAVAAASASDVRARIQSALASKILRLRTTTGVEYTHMIEREEVAAAIVEYRPVYVRGDVFKNGEQTYRPNMTVRQALSLAGGYDTMQFRMNGPVLDLPKLRSDYTSTWMDLAKEHARVWRIRTELGEKVAFDRNAIPAAPVSQSTLSQIVSLESEYASKRQADLEHEKDFIRRSIKQADEQVEILEEQQQKEEQGAQADAYELQRVTELLAKGALTSQRVTDARRAVLLSSTRKLQTTAQLMQVKRQSHDLSRQLEKIDDLRRIALLRELQDSSVEFASLHAKVQSIEEKLHSVGARPPRAFDAAQRADITVFRKTGSGRERLVVDDDFELQPGDVVEVALRSEPIEVAAQ
jgi:polysaccharide export outer membrane protein